VLGSLIEEARLRPAEVESRVASALQPRYWASLAPGARGRSGPALTAAPSGLAVRALARRFAVEGWIGTGPAVSAAVLARMRRCVDAVRAAGWPPVFAFVYEDFWRVVRAPWLRRFLTAVLGAGYRENVRVWCYRIVPERGCAGWPPHVDGQVAAGRATVWIPLTDATLENGCIYLVPQDLVPPSIGSFATRGEFRHAEVVALLQRSRAVPARAGSVLAWNHGVIHWGATCGRPDEPRVSVAYEFIAAGVEPNPQELPLLDAGPRIPPLATRLRAIATAILAYDRFEPGLVRYRALAQRLLERLR